MPYSQALEAFASIAEQMSQRCAQLGMAVWSCDAAGKMLKGPCDAPIDRDRLEQSAAALAASDIPLPTEVADDHWLIPLEYRCGSKRLAMLVALLKTREPQDVARVGTMLSWMLDEMVRAKHDETTIEQFSEKLAQAYEETDVLYRMARLLNCGTEATDAIRKIGSQLQEVLPFQWLAIRFSPTSKGVRELAGETIVAGKPPFALEMLTPFTETMMLPAEGEWKKVLTPANDELARLADAEVLAEPITHDDKVIGVLMAGNKIGNDPSLSSAEMKFLAATADFLSVFHENLSRFNEQQEMFIGTLQALTASIDAKDPYTLGHSQRVGLMASKMAAALGLDKHLVEQYRIAGLVHDVGKIGVPEAVLTKPGRLTPEEFEMIKLHPGIGHRILNQIPSLSPVLPGVLWHHERWDGRGYPDGVSGEQIPLIARVLALADTFDAMSSNRSYRPAIARPKVLEEILKNGGAQFDPELAPLFVKLDFSDFDAELESHRTAEQKAA